MNTAKTNIVMMGPITISSNRSEILVKKFIKLREKFGKQLARSVILSILYHRQRERKETSKFRVEKETEKKYITILNTVKSILENNNKFINTDIGNREITDLDKKIAKFLSKYELTFNLAQDKEKFNKVLENAGRVYNTFQKPSALVRYIQYSVNKDIKNTATYLFQRYKINAKLNLEGKLKKLRDKVPANSNVSKFVTNKGILNRLKSMNLTQEYESYSIGKKLIQNAIQKQLNGKGRAYFIYTPTNYVRKLDEENDYIKPRLIEWTRDYIASLFKKEYTKMKGKVGNTVAGGYIKYLINMSLSTGYNHNNRVNETMKHVGVKTNNKINMIYEAIKSLYYNQSRPTKVLIENNTNLRGKFNALRNIMKNNPPTNPKSILLKLSKK